MRKSIGTITTVVGALVLTVLAALAISTFIKGDYINGHFVNQTSFDTSIGGPFELTNSTSRYVLTQAMVDNHSFALTDSQARYASPDLVKFKDTYLSIFTPGISLLGIPLYWLGKSWGVPQLLTYLLNPVVLLLDIGLVALVSRKLGSSPKLAIMSGLIFAFATNALVYANTYTQHVVTVALICASLLLAVSKLRWWQRVLLGVAYGAAVLVDIPNAFMLLPPVFVAMFKDVELTTIKDRVKLQLPLTGVWLLIGVLPFLVLFGYYNYQLTGSYFTLGQFIGRYDYPDTNPTVKTAETKAAELLQTATPSAKLPELGFGLDLPFESRSQLEGAHILLTSRQRSWWYYSPVVWLGVLGLTIAYLTSTTKKTAVMVISVIAIDILLYSSFGDPWGGWAFGPRYLIPAAALLTAGIGTVATYCLRRRWLGLGLALVLAMTVVFSVYTNVLGGVTTAAIPPKGEAEALQNDTPWTTLYNQRLVTQNRISSLVFNEYLKDIVTGREFITYLTAFCSSLIGVMFVLGWWENRKVGTQK